jgi:hypothetical protein
VNKLKKIFKNCGINCCSDTKGKAIDELYALSESGQLGSGGGSAKPVKIYKFVRPSIGEYFTFSPLKELKVGDFCFNFIDSNYLGTRQIKSVTEYEIVVDNYSFSFNGEYELKDGYFHRNDGYVE